MNSNEKEPLDFSKNIENISKEFNENIKNFQPMAFLGSLSLVIATFSADKYGSAKDYAIVASFCFLLAFLTSLVIKILNLSRVTFFSLVPILFNLFGVISLFVVSWEFAKTSVMLNNAIEIIKFLPYIIINIFIYTKQDFYRTIKLSSIRSVKILNIVMLLIYIISCIILFAYASTKIFSLFWNMEINYPFLKNGLSEGLGLIGLVIFIDMLIKYIIRFDEKNGIYKYSLIFNDAINYNSSLGIIFVSLNMIFNNDYFFPFLGTLGYIIILINLILIIIKIKILPSL